MNDLQKFRKTIDQLDRTLIDTLAKRQQVVRKVGEYKKKEGLPPLDEKRFKDVLTRMKEYALERGLPKDFVEDIFNRIHKNSLEIEQ